MKRRIVYVCAPYGGTIDDQIRNTTATIRRCRLLYEQGCNPIAPQIYYPRFLDDNDPAERRDGLDAAKDWLKHCDVVYVYGDRITPGMCSEIEMAKKLGIPIKHVTDAKNAACGSGFPTDGK